MHVRSWRYIIDDSNDKKLNILIYYVVMFKRQNLIECLAWNYEEKDVQESKKCHNRT